MKSGAAFWVFVVALAIASSTRGQGTVPHAAGLPTQESYATRTTGIGTTSKNATGASPSATPDPESNTAEEDDALYRGKTSDSESVMLRDEGALHFKTHPKEKVHEVDSLKSLQTTGSDPKFQGSLITSGANPIERVAEKTGQARQAGDWEYQGDPRFRDKHLTLSSQKDGEPKKSQTESSPSPTPSPSASPAKKSSRSKE